MNSISLAVYIYELFCILIYYLCGDNSVVLRFYFAYKYSEEVLWKIKIVKNCTQVLQNNRTSPATIAA